LVGLNIDLDIIYLIKIIYNKYDKVFKNYNEIKRKLQNKNYSLKIINIPNFLNFSRIFVIQFFSILLFY